MSLLLLLSALLSALTGVGGAVRSPDVAQAVAGSATTAPAAVVQRRAVSHRPVAGLPSLRTLAATAFAAGLPLAAREPLWASRRRE